MCRVLYSHMKNYYLSSCALLDIFSPFYKHPTPICFPTPPALPLPSSLYHPTLLPTFLNHPTSTLFPSSPPPYIIPPHPLPLLPTSLYHPPI